MFKLATCQCSHSSARKHYLGNLALFFSWTDKPSADLSPHNVNQYIHYCLEKSLSHLTINRRLSSLRLFIISSRLAAITVTFRIP
ncbi:MAG: phage integrase N-terminal SAM-like domain-containing protein [Anaerolineales bacterium]|nr:phage integrase N-terminal SAM-like domain-containing protein [Anaerolineales bacterium]